MKKNIFIIILSFLVVGLAGFIAYDNFIKKPEPVKTKCDVKETKKAEKTADERYKEYLTNLSKSIDNNYKEVKDFDNPGLINETTYIQAIEGVEYTISINESKQLYVSYGISDIINPEYKKYKIADNVVSYFRVHLGNGGYYSLYYLTTEGKLYNVNVEMLPTDKPREPQEVTGVKNIIEVKDGTSVSAGVAIFVDIDGNIFTPDLINE